LAAIATEKTAANSLFWGKFPQPGRFIRNYPEVVLYFGQLVEATYFLWNLLKVTRHFALFGPRLPAV
jgi:hypothetical protein